MHPDENMYVLVDGTLPSDLAYRVNRSIKDGWVPIGGPFVYPFGNQDRLYQAIIREAKDES